jgi:hypothetical protein
VSIFYYVISSFHIHSRILTHSVDCWILMSPALFYTETICWHETDFRECILYPETFKPYVSRIHISDFRWRSSLFFFFFFYIHLCLTPECTTPHAMLHYIAKKLICFSKTDQNFIVFVIILARVYVRTQQIVYFLKY